MQLNLKCKVNSIQIKIDCTLKENAKQNIPYLFDYKPSDFYTN